MIRLLTPMSLRTKLVLASVVVEVCMLTLLVGNSLRLMQDRLLDQARVRTTELNVLLNAAVAAPLAQRDYATLADLLEQSRRDRGIEYLALQERAGGPVVVAAGWERGRPLPASKAEISADDIVPGSRLELYVPIELAGQTLGRLYYGISTEFLASARSHLLRQSVLIAGAEVVLSIVLLALLGLWLTRSLGELSRAAHVVADGNFDLRLVPRSRDEVGALVRAFNAMAERIRADRQNLQSANAELEQRVKDRTAELEAANRELEAFSYSVSHDLRAPLRAIDGFSRVLVEDHASHLDAEAQDYLNRVRNAVQRMGVLIDDLLDLSRVGRAAMHVTAVDLSSLAAEVVAQLRHGSPARTVEVDIAPGITAQGDPRLLRVVLENLLGNAWKYTGRTAAAHIVFAAGTSDGQRIYRIADNGAGFDMQYADKLFRPFQRLHSPQEFPGSGVGLATVARIVHRHGGRAWAEGAAGKGATFSFTLGSLAGGSGSGHGPASRSAA